MILEHELLTAAYDWFYQVEGFRGLARAKCQGWSSDRASKPLNYNLWRFGDWGLGVLLFRAWRFWVLGIYILGTIVWWFQV